MIYDLEVRDVRGNPLSLEKFRGKILLVVNTASSCGFTPQFAELQSIYEQYQSQGFELLAMPSNDFLQQEPLSGEDLQTFCETKYHTTFTITEKVHVKGLKQHPVFALLVKKLGVKALPRWNFYKYLIDRNGEVVTYFVPFTKPTSKKITKTIERLLQT